MTQRPIKVFYSYSHADESHREALEKHLATIRRTGLVTEWHDRCIQPGGEWEAEIDSALRHADVILFLVSADFIHSDYCYGIEVGVAMERHREGAARVIPIIVRPVDFLGTPFAELQALPTDAKAVTTFTNEDEGWLDVALGVRAVCDELAHSRAEDDSASARSSTAVPEDNGQQAAPQVPEGIPQSLPWNANGADLFFERMQDAFPEATGMTEYRGSDAVDRLAILLRPPVHQDPVDPEADLRRHPFWWFRGGSNMHIRRFERLSDHRVLIFPMEMEVRRVVVFRISRVKERDLVYVETEGDEPSGVYQYGPEEIDNHLRERIDSRFGSYVSEEYAQWGQHVITLSEFDNDAVVLDGELHRPRGAERRMRFLTPFNCVLCPREHVVNQNRFDRLFQSIFDGVLEGERGLDDLADALQAVPYPEYG